MGIIQQNEVSTLSQIAEDLRKIKRIYRRRWFAAISFTIFCGIFAGIISQFVLTPVYQAKTLLMITVATNELQTQTMIRPQIGDNGQYMFVPMPVLTMNTYLTHLQSPEMLKRVISNQDLYKYSVAELGGMIEANLVKESNLIEVNVSSSDPSQAALIANSISEEYVKLMDELNFSSVVVLSAADVPDKPTGPNKVFNIEMAIILGLLLSVPLVLFLEQMDTTIRTADDVNKVLKQTVLALIPRKTFQNSRQNGIPHEEMQAGLLSPNDTESLQGKKIKHGLAMKVANKPVEDPDPTPITYKKPKSALAEAYRHLRTNLDMAYAENAFKTVLVTSAVAMDGKSSVASNLAVVESQAGRKVILVDCDLRKPIQHHIFATPNNRGVTDCIINNEDPDSMAHIMSIDALRLLTSGPIPENPAEIINSANTSRLWSQLKSKYDLVVIDSPPILAVTDASILATQVDASIMVVGSGQTREEEAMLALDKLAKTKVRMLGIILNQVDFDKDDPYGYYYY